MTPEVSAFIAEARRWIGRPFLHQGSNWDGVDCIGLVVSVCRARGLLPEDFALPVYGRMPANGILDAGITSLCTRVEVAEPGTLLVVAWAREAAHVAICTGETMIHSYENVGRVIEHGYRGRWVRLTHSIWRLPGLKYE